MAATGFPHALDNFTISCRRLEDADLALTGRQQAPKEGVVISVAGEVDLATARVVEAELRRAEVAQELIVLDLREVTFMDSTGVRIAVQADQRARERGAELVIVQGPAQVRRVFELTGIDHYLEVVEPPQ